MALNTMKDLLIDQLDELYAAEKHCLAVLPDMAAAATSPELADAIHRQVAQTTQHVSRLKEVFSELGAIPKQQESKGMKGLLEDCLELAQDTDAEPHVRDAALIAVAQHVKHDEIAGYGCARCWASLIGSPHAAATLEATLREERDADAGLSRIADRINVDAVAPVTS
jgi:ferritin-like metal-binding protein YciE